MRLLSPTAGEEEERNSSTSWVVTASSHSLMLEAEDDVRTGILPLIRVPVHCGSNKCFELKLKGENQKPNIN